MFCPLARQYTQKNGMVVTMSIGSLNAQTFVASNRLVLAALSLVAVVCFAALCMVSGGASTHTRIPSTVSSSVVTDSTIARHGVPIHDGDDNKPPPTLVIHASESPLSFGDALVLAAPSTDSLLLPLRAAEPMAPRGDGTAFGDYSFALTCKRQSTWCEAPDVNCTDFPILVVNACGLQGQVGAERLCRCHEKRLFAAPDLFVRAEVQDRDVTIAALVKAQWRTSRSGGELVHLSRASVATQYNRCIGYNYLLGKTYQVVCAARRDVAEERYEDRHRCLSGGSSSSAVCSYYGFDNTAFNAGHSLEAIVEALGQYVASGLHEQRVPWISFVPSASDYRSSKSGVPVFHQFVHEILDVAGIPVLELPFSRTIRLPRVAVAQLEFGKNSWCWKQVAHAFLRPLAESEGTRVFASLDALRRFGIAASRNLSLERISLLKLHGDQTSLHRPGFRKTARFSNLLELQNVTVLPVTLPVLPRMLAVSRAELIVTSWGSTGATVIHLLDAQRGRHRSSTKPLLLLVLVHPDYIFEARFLFNRSGHALRRSSKKRSITLHEQLNQHNGLHWDYDGGPNFCARFVLVRTLDQVDTSDFESCRR